MNAEIRQLITQLVDAWNTYDVERALGFYTPDCTEEDVALAQPQTGTEGIRTSITRYVNAFPDMHLEIERLIVEDSQAVLMWKMSGNHRGRLLNIPPTGRKVVVEGVSLFTVENGYIRHTKRIWDLAGLLRSLGLLPDL